MKIYSMKSMSIRENIFKMSKINANIKFHLAD